MTTSASGPRTATFLLRQPKQVQGFHEPLAEGLALPLLWIPPGRFWMGSPESEAERRASESPQHLVQLTGFFQGQTPITQAQWRAVAQWEPREGERWGKALSPNPSFFVADALVDRERSSATPTTEDDRRPVEQVSWDDAMEFCSRLSQRTGRHYTLPSEAQWEYACRAGTSTPFAFGDTITPGLANYDGNDTYGQGRKGEVRGQTTPVGMFPANAWGLQDMHGNVWEWCLDHWHESYEGAPEDGSAWLSEQGGERLLRGGAWLSDPGGCRSAVRYHLVPVNADGYIGFRVVCLPQGPSREKPKVVTLEDLLGGGPFANQPQGGRGGGGGPRRPWRRPFGDQRPRGSQVDDIRVLVNRTQNNPSSLNHSTLAVS